MCNYSARSLNLSLRSHFLNDFVSLRALAEAFEAPSSKQVGRLLLGTLPRRFLASSPAQ